MSIAIRVSQLGGNGGIHVLVTRDGKPAAQTVVRPRAELEAYEAFAKAIEACVNAPSEPSAEAAEPMPASTIQALKDAGVVFDE